MAELQTSYSENLANGYPGMVASGALSNRISRTVEDSAGIAFGKFAWRGSGDHGCTLTPTAGTLLGVTIANAGQQIYSGGSADTYAQYDNAALMTEGEILVTGAVAAADGDQVYVTSAGAITNVSTSNVIAPGWFFDITTAGAGLTKIAKR